MTDEPETAGQGPSAGAVWANWSQYDAPALTKFRMAVRNNLKKVRTGEGCCGNHGQPGC